jgi:predicted GH43/DUF377 family glycosyl hydrolase
MIALPVCRWRGEFRTDRYVCRSARFLEAPNLVRPEFCAECYYADHAPPPPLPPALPCVHLGGVLAGDGGSSANGGTAQLKSFGCAVHGRCTPAGTEADPPGNTRCCARCPDYLARDPFSPDSGQMRRRAEAFLAALPAYPSQRYHGRGVVIAGGGDRYFASLYVTVRALRHVGCRLPIQVWYLGRNDEMPPRRQALLAPYQVECVDADAVRRRHPARNLGGWELKVFATLHCGFEELLFLDADSYPCRNPEFLFAREDYRARGAIFWPDLAMADTRLKWPAYGVPDPRRPGSVESGQYVLHKRASWRPLNLAWFYNDHSDYYYRYGHGDKHTFEVAWARCGQPYVMWQPTADWAEVAYVHAGPDGQPLFVHRCAAKFCFKPEAYSTPQRSAGQAFLPQLPLERHCWDWLGELTRALALTTQAAGHGLVPQKLIRIGLPGHFNCSLVEHRGRLLLASRQGSFGARLWLSELDPDYQPRWTRPLALAHARAPSGVEDPRLFLYRGRLHCAFTGLEDDGPTRHIHQLVCRLGEDYRPARVWFPRYQGRKGWEKNWQFFEYQGGLYSIYSIRPHVILRHRGQRAELAAQTTALLPWTDCHLRGGAPPVRVGDEYYHFFHSMKETGGQYEYALGLYTFTARPPFAIRRVAAAPLLSAGEYDRPAASNKLVVFPCGALLRAGCWVISYGYHDQECRVAVFAADQIEQRLQGL